MAESPWLGMVQVFDHFVDLAVCGTVGVSVDGGPRVPVRGRQPQTVIAYLTMNDRDVHLDELAYVLWGDDLGKHWTGALRGVLSKLRRTLSEAGAPEHLPLLRSIDGIVRIQAQVTCEVTRATELAAATQQLEERALLDLLGDLDTCAAELSRPFLAHDDSEWARAERYRIAALRDRIDHAVIRGLRTAGRVDDAIVRARERLANSPTDEVTHVALIDLLIEQGSIGAAIDAFRGLEWMLSAEYGVAPDPAVARRVLEAGVDRGADMLSMNRNPRPVTPDPAPPPKVEPTSNPAGQHPHASEPFIGRSAELAIIDRAAERIAAGGSAELVVIRGPAGIGKSRLADHAAVRAARSFGLATLRGTSRPTVDRPFGPVADAIANAIASRRDLAEHLDPIAPALEFLLGLSDGPADRVHERSALASARRQALTTARQAFEAIVDAPTVMVIDDLQWASGDGLALLEEILTGSPLPLLVLLTHRDPAPSVASAVAQIQLRVPVETITLEALSLTELDEMCRASEVAIDDIEDLRRSTGGVAYFAAGLIRDALRHDARIDLRRTPSSIRDWIEYRLAVLTDDQRAISEIVAVLGSAAGLDAIEAVSGLAAAEVADCLDALAAEGLVAIGDDGTVGVPHDLTAESIVRSIGPARRALLHRLAGDHLGIDGTDEALRAYHYELAGRSRAIQAIDARLSAGVADLRRGAWASAAEHFAMVVERATVPLHRIRALIGAGVSHLHRNQHGTAQELLSEAVELAEEHGHPIELAEAALGLVGRAGRGASTDDDLSQQQLLRRVRRNLLGYSGQDDHRRDVLLSRLELELALTELFSSDIDQRRRLVEGALNRMRALPNPHDDDLAQALLGQRPVKLDGAGVLQRLGDLDEVLSLPSVRLDPATRMAAHAYRHEDLLMVGRLQESRADLQRAAELAEHYDNPYWSWVAGTWAVVEAIGDGDLDRAEARAGEAAALRPDILGAAACYQVNLVNIRLLQGRATEVIPALTEAVQHFPQIPTYRAVLALVLCEAGRLDQAAAVVRSFADDGYELPQDPNRALGLAVLAHVAATVEDVAASAALHRQLEQFADLLVVINCYGGGGAMWGPTSWALARTAGAAGRSPVETAALWANAASAAAPFPAFADRVLRDAAAAGCVPARIA